MNTLLLSFLFTLASLATASHSTNAAYKEIRNNFAFDHQTKWDCFYRTTTPVKDMDPAIWRRDQFGNLLMAGLNYNCTGCLCYTFDHRYPISKIATSKRTGRLVALMSSIHNCQALSFRTNALKGSNEDDDIQHIVDRFGCDKKTMKLFEDEGYKGARAVQKYLLSDERIEQIHEYYIAYVTGDSFFDPSKVKQSKERYFKHLNKNSNSISEKIDAEIAVQ